MARFFKRSEKQPDPHPSSSAFETRHFSFTVPGEWDIVEVNEQDGAPWVYRSGKGDEQLTVSVMTLRAGISADERREIFQSFVRLRSNFLAKDRETDKPASLWEYPELMFGVDAGTRPGDRIMDATLYACTAHQMGAFFYELMLDSLGPETYKNHVNAVIDSLILTDTKSSRIRRPPRRE